MNRIIVLPIFVLTGSLALAQLTAISYDASAPPPGMHMESKLANEPRSMSKPTSAEPEPYIELRTTPVPKSPLGEHARFFDKRNLELLALNVGAQTQALFCIQSHGGGGANWAQSSGRTFDPFEKHFESYGYGWGAVYRYGGGVGLNSLVAYALHRSGHHRLERLLPLIAIGHAEASSAYALTGSKQGSGGW